jgi:hypothetical protein
LPSPVQEYRTIFSIIFTLFGIILSALYGVILSGLHYKQSYTYYYFPDAIGHLSTIMSGDIYNYVDCKKIFTYIVNAIFMCMPFIFLIMSYMDADIALQSLSGTSQKKHATVNIKDFFAKKLASSLLLMLFSSLLLPISIAAYHYAVYSFVISAFLIIFFIISIASLQAKRTTNIISRQKG